MAQDGLAIAHGPTVGFHKSPCGTTRINNVFSPYVHLRAFLGKLVGVLLALLVCIKSLENTFVCFTFLLQLCFFIVAIAFAAHVLLV